MAAQNLSREELEHAVSLVNTHGGNVSKAAIAVGWSRGKLEGRLRAAAVAGIGPDKRPSSADDDTAHYGDVAPVTAAAEAVRARLGLAPPGVQERVTETRKTRLGRKHLVIPDVQAKPGVPLDHLTHVGKFIAHKRPDVIVCIGDFADMASLSSYDKGTLGFEGRRYVDDIDVAHRAMEMLISPFAGIEGYRPRMVLTLGNHEDRITRAVNASPEFEGKLSMADLGYAQWGWEVIPYLTPILIDGVEYCHYFTSGVMGRPVSSASALLRARQRSAVMGHVQSCDIAMHQKTQQTAMFVGTCYQHDESYLGPQGNVCRRQVVMLHEVQDGVFDPMLVSLDFLRKKYG